MTTHKSENHLGWDQFDFFQSDHHFLEHPKDLTKRLITTQNTLVTVANSHNTSCTSHLYSENVQILFKKCINSSPPPFIHALIMFKYNQLAIYFYSFALST